MATQKFKRLRAFARFRSEIWCMDFVYIDKLAKENNGVKYLLVRQDLFNRTVNAKGMKTKDSEETVKVFSSMNTEKNRPKNIWVDKGTEFDGPFAKFCTAEGIQVYHIMSETKAAFAERTRRSLINVLYRNMEDFGYRYIHKLPRSCYYLKLYQYRKELRLYIFPFTLNLYENTRNLHSKRETECESQSMAYLFAKVTSPNIHEKFLKLWQLQQKNHQHTQSRMSKTRLFEVNFIKKSWLKSFNNGFVDNRVGF